MADGFTSYEGNALLWIVYHNHGTTHVHALTESIALARFMAYVEETDADLLLLDEPTGALDRETAERMISLIKKLAENRTAIIVTHNEADAEAFADRILRI